MDAFTRLWRAAAGARAYFVAAGQGGLATSAGYVALMVLAYERLGFITIASAVPLILGAYGVAVSRRDRRGQAVSFPAEGGPMRRGEFVRFERSVTVAKARVRVEGNDFIANLRKP